MKVVAYNIKKFEKEELALANAKVHDFTLISNELNLRTFHYAIGKQVVIICEDDHVEPPLLDALYDVGVTKIITRSFAVDHIDLDYANKIGMHIANIPDGDPTPKNVAVRTIAILNNWADGTCLGEACRCLTSCPHKICEILQNND